MYLYNKIAILICTYLFIFFVNCSFSMFSIGGHLAHIINSKCSLWLLTTAVNFPSINKRTPPYLSFLSLASETKDKYEIFKNK